MEVSSLDAFLAFISFGADVAIGLSVAMAAVMANVFPDSGVQL